MDKKLYLPFWHPILGDQIRTNCANKQLRLWLHCKIICSIALAKPAEMEEVPEGADDEVVEKIKENNEKA